MDRTFRITPGLEGKVAIRSLKNVLITMICVFIFFIFYSVTSKIPIATSLLSLCFTTIIVGAIFYANIGFGIIVAKTIVFKVSDDALSRNLDIDESKLNFIQLYGWQKNKLQLKLICIKWIDIKSITDKGHSLLIKSRNTNILNGNGMLMLPKEIEGFDELDKIIRSKVAPYGVEY
jgi:hypothetical protein